MLLARVIGLSSLGLLALAGCRTSDDDDDHSDSGETSGLGDGDDVDSGDGDGDSGDGDSGDGDGDDDDSGDGDGDGDLGHIGSRDWLPGAPQGQVAGADLRELPSSPSGPPIWVSNNPERFTSNGWLVLHSRTDPNRGGAADPLAGSFPAYLFHLNGSGAGKWLHLVASNPQAAAISVSAIGSIYTNGEHPLGGPGTGPSYRVAADWLTQQPAITIPTQVIAPGTGVVLLSKAVGPNQMIDGRFELEASAGVYLYAVITSSNDAAAAINASQGAPATGDIALPGPNAYGREAGLYEHGELIATLSATLPPGPGHLGFCFNTVAKFAWDGELLQEQTAAARTIHSDSAERTWGNYGHHFVVEIDLQNPGPDSRTVRLAIASLFTANTDQPSFTWSAPMRVGPVDDAQVVQSWTTPTKPVDELGSWVIAGEAELKLRVEAYVPGLITAGQQLHVIAE
jgi:hypothetical protein